MVPYWEPVVVESNHRTEQFFLDVLEEVKLMYHIHPQKVLVTGFGLGATEAFSLAALYPDQFQAVAAIASSPLRDKLINRLMEVRLMGNQKFREMPPVLLVRGENDTSWTMDRLNQDKALLEKQGVKTEVKQIPGMGSEHNFQANAFILNWFDSKVSDTLFAQAHA